MARPNKKEAAQIIIRNKEILKMAKRGYPLGYISAFFNLSNGRTSKIINQIEKVEVKKSSKNG